MEELTGILTGGYEALRNMEKVSSGIITISQRLRGVSESGEEIDGLMPKLQEKFKKFAGIDIQTVNGELRSTYDILQDLSEVWSTLSDEERSEIGFLSSGIRQAPVLNAILKNWQNVELAAESATNSTNSAIIENEKYLASLEGKINLLNSALSKLAYDTISNVFVGSLIDLTTGLVKITNSIGILNIALVGVITYFSMFKTSLLFIPIINAATIAISKLTIGLNLSTAAAIKLNTALGMFAPLAIAAAIYGLVKAFDALNVTMSEYNEQVTKSFNETQDNIDSIKQLKEEYENLNKETSLSREQKLRLLDIERELRTKYQETTSELDLQNKSLEENSKTIDEIIRKESERFLLLNKRSAQEAEELLNSDYYVRSYSEEQKQFESLAAAIEHYKKALAETSDVDNLGYDERKKILEKLYKEYDDANDIINKVKYHEDILNDAIERLNSSLGKQPSAVFNVAQSQKDLQKTTSDLLGELDSLAKAYATLNEGKQLSTKEIYDLVTSYEELMPHLKEKEGRLYLEKDAILQVMGARELAFKDEIQQTINSAKANQNALFVKLSHYGMEVSAIGDLIEARRKLSETYDVGDAGLSTGIRSQFDSVAKEASKIQDYIDTLSKFGSTDFTSSAISSASSSSSASSAIKQISQYISEQSKQTLDSINLLITQSQGRLSKLTEGSSEYRKELETQISLHRQLQSEYSTEANRLRERNAAINEQLSSLPSWNKMTDEQKELFNSLSKELDNNATAVNGLSSSWWNAEKAIDSVATSIQSDAEKINDAFNQFQSFLFYNIEEEIRQLQILKTAAKETAQEKIDAIQSQIDALTTQNNLLKEQEDREKKLLDILKQKEKVANIEREKNVQIFKDGEFVWIANPRELAQEQEKLQDMQTDYFKWEEDLRKQKEIEALKLQIKNIQDELKAEETRFDNRIAALQKFIADEKREIEFQDKFKIKSLGDLMIELEGVEESSYADRLEALKLFMTEYNKIAGFGASLPSSSSSGSSSNPLGMSDSDFNTYVANKIAWNNPATDEKTKLAAHIKNQELRNEYEIKEDKYSASDLTKYLQEFKSGGFTGNFSGGKLGILHEKELVLNKVDTSNILKAVEIARDAFRNFTVPRFDFPSLRPAMAGASGGDTFQISEINVRTNDARTFTRNFAMEAKRRRR